MVEVTDVVMIIIHYMQLRESAREQKHAEKFNKKSQSVCMDIIKRMNGFKESLWKDMEKIETIELVLEDFGSMSMFYRFKGLKSLTLINVGISAIEGLNECVKLEHLWLNENWIGKIEGLEKNINLKSLYLSHNQIKKLEGLNSLEKLETFWICDNHIETLENIGGLKSLKQLWIASNSIQYIKTALDPLTELTDLNLSGNKICSFKQILNLNRLPNLKMLSLYDPHFGENPICTLSNYQTYMLYHLKGISKLDTLHLSDEAKVFAESTYMRKKMYYNMRIKTIERHFSTLSKLVKKAADIKIDSLNEDLENIHVKLRDPEGDTSQVQETYRLRIQELLHVKEVYNAVKKRLLEISKISIRKLITELETGGNIRLQQGKPEDKWYKSCEDLIKSRYHQLDLISMGISSINVKRVIRIHNRFLKQKFQEKIQSVYDISNANYKKNIEYLFYGMDHYSPQEVDQIMEEGFRSAEESKKLGLCPYTALVHTLVAGDLPRLNHYAKNKINAEKLNKDFIKHRNYNTMKLYPPGWLFVCKVPMIKSSNDDIHPYFDPEISPSENLKLHPISLKESETAIMRVKQSDPTRIKVWFMLDNSLVLPEYYVEFQYILIGQKQNKVADFGEAIALLETQNDEFIGSMSPQQINQIYNNLVSEIGNYQFQNIEDFDNSNLQIQAADLDRIDLGHTKTTLINYFKYCLCRSNSYHSYNQNNTLQPTEEFDLNKLKINGETIANLKYINFSNFKIKDVSFLKDFVNLETAILSSNLISKISDIEKCPSIKVLDLSRNSIESLVGLSALKSLTYLDISHNDISNVESLKLLQLNQELEEIVILFNPFKDPKLAQSRLSIQSKSLKRINYMDASDLREKFTNDKNQKWITASLLHKYTTSNKKIEAIELEKLEHLYINYEKITSLKGIEELVNLRKINLSHNRIEKIEAIEKFRLLEELNLEDNLITKISHLEKLVFLKNLELGKNKISKIEGIHTLSNLSQLSLEDNLLSTLEGFPELKSLAELYLGNNKITDSREVKYLKDLQKLIILDMSGNPVSKDSSYRIYTLYILRKLKVLDGISIEGFQQQQAKEHFTGRLTEEILRQKLDEGYTTQNVKILDLRNSRLKDFDDMFTQKQFPVLTELDLSQNEFTSVKMFGNLPTLSILVLQHNKIDSLLCCTDINMLKGLNGCQSLTILDLSHNYLKDFHGLQYCRLGELKMLKASRNEINKIDCLENLKQLKELDVCHNKIRQIDPFSFQAKNMMKCLKIDDNLLKNFNNCQKLTKLYFLFAHSNRIQQFHDIDRLTELNNLHQLELNGNSICRRGGYRMTMIKKLPTLFVLDGKDITSDERVDMQVHQSPVIPPNYIQMQLNQKQVPIRMSSVDFGGVFTSNRPGDGNPPGKI